MALFYDQAVPLYWHVMTLFPIAKVRFRRWRLGSNYELFVKRQGVIGQSPFQARTISKHCATWNSCEWITSHFFNLDGSGSHCFDFSLWSLKPLIGDFMLHLSNSAYAIALDEARCEWHVKMLALTMRNDMEQVRPLIASTHFAYFIEIPVRFLFFFFVTSIVWSFLSTQPTRSDHLYLALIDACRLSGRNQTGQLGSQMGTWSLVKRTMNINAQYQIIGFLIGLSDGQVHNRSTQGFFNPSRKCEFVCNSWWATSFARICLLLLVLIKRSI